MIFYKTGEEIERIRKSSLLVGKTLAEVAKKIKPGVSTLELDKLAEEFIRDHGAEPGFLDMVDSLTHFVRLLMKQLYMGSLMINH